MPCIGVQASHGSSLAELLAQHGLVKVQLNAACEGPDAAGAQLAEAAGMFAPQMQIDLPSVCLIISTCP